MRAYQIIIQNPATGQVFAPPSSAPAGSNYSYTSFIGSQVLPNALNIEIDLPHVAYHAPDAAAGSFLRISGVSLQEIAQASDLNGYNIAVSGGFKKGLPLANPAQFGLLAQGTIFQAFGNWIGTEQSIDLILAPGTGTLTTTAGDAGSGPKNFTLNWRAGQPLAQALATTLSTALPSYKQNISLNPNLVTSHDQPGFYPTLQTLAEFCYLASLNIIGDDSYPGVQITITGTTVNAFDGTTPLPAKQIQFQELIGQPTWIHYNVIQFKCPMRADIQLGDAVTLPQGTLTTQTAQSFASYRSKSVFQGTFTITDVHHFGNFRQPDAASWVSTFDAIPNPAPQANNSTSNVPISA